MSKIKNAFSDGKAFIAFLTAGDPSLEKTVDYILAIEEAGADLVEIGIPFSDPTAEGIVIQDANIRALKEGMTVDGVFEIVSRVREKSQIPLVFLTYLNPVFHYGYENFFLKCENLGVDGIIIPDLPYEEKEEMSVAAESHHVDVISMIAPTSRQRIQMIAEEAKGFLYVVSSMGVTGVRSNIETDITSMIASIREVTDIPAAVGFGISTPEQAERMAAASDGAIVGSAIVKLIEKYGDRAEEPIAEYVKSMKEAVKRAGN
ncbi:tryptophan synthase subunit alpha [Faecalicatena contorta]|uniref:Tryptophan synthase alpha chain n=1 Tax=Faecalicatena contorta TaxID=39482 RepID=A0A316A4M5_9FIRM|nr:tryptophan synthase subunit alpha [Faecalicatena contorta]PWJ51910.1 tryptophan synthase alpha chain [Faecalicatena contorta]SUQ12188.1 tryptophan synthase, alpha chain [Faecalicatena contorta]